jgi:hypothetical protein
MANNYDAEIKNVRAVDAGKESTLDTVANGQDFDVLADVEAGAAINAVAVRDQLFVTVRNLSQFKVVFYVAPARVLTPDGDERRETLRVPVTGWTAREGDKLDVSVTYRFDAGIFKDHSDKDSDPFIVTA